MSNFAPLDSFFPDLAKLGRSAESAFAEDPRATMSHLRVWGERVTIELLDRYRMSVYAESQIERVRRLRSKGALSPKELDDLHTLRIEGNKAVHAYGRVSHTEAMKMLRSAANLVRWLWREFTPKEPPKPGTFVKPSAASSRGEAAILRAQLEAERKERQRATSEMQDLLRMLDMPQVATFAGVEASFRLLEPEQQEQIGVFLKLFREEPIHEDWPLERVEGVQDDKVRLVRQHGLGVLVIEPPRGDLLIIARVGPVEDCVGWAQGRRFEVHPVVGTLQIYDVEEAEQAVEGQSGGLFQDHSDEALGRLGLPVPLLPSVRRLASEADLDALAEHLPPEAADGLYLLASGYDLESTLAELKTPETVDAQDFAVALHHPQSARSFRLIEDDEDLAAVLAGPLEAWRIYLHPDQLRLVQMNANGPVRVLGGAGTGKTVALLHRCAHLLREHFVGSERLLLTTYTRNLASDLAEHLGHLLSPEELQRVEVRNLHSLVSELWKQHGDGRGLSFSDARGQAWRRAMTYDQLGRPSSFYQDEWESIVQGQGLTDERGYLRARRVGRGVALNRGDRRKAWAVFAAYRTELDEQGRLEQADVLRLLSEGLESGSIPRPFAAALCDEVQDLGAPELRFLRALIPAGAGDLFLVGDGHQRIFGQPVRFSACGIEIRGRSRRLKVNYRNTAHVRYWTVKAVEGAPIDDLDGGEDNLKGYRSLRLGLEPREHLLASRGEERARIRQTVLDWLDHGVPATHICLAAPTNRQVEDLRELLEDADVPSVVLDTDSSSAGEGVRLATFHRMKGLEFPCVLLSHVEQGQVPLRNRVFAQLDEGAQAAWDQRYRCLLYVAATRARDELVVTAVGSWSPWVRA
jgi:superfamily I DNA/RNA helicase